MILSIRENGNDFIDTEHVFPKLCSKAPQGASANSEDI